MRILRALLLALLMAFVIGLVVGTLIRQRMEGPRVRYIGGIHAPEGDRSASAVAPGPLHVA